MSAERKTCTRCQLWLPLDSFTKSKRSKDGRQWFCKSCDHAKYLWARENRDFVKEYNHGYQILNLYGITAEQYAEKLAEQGGVCANRGCGKTPEENGKRLSVDHDHSCCPGVKSCGKCVRGLLCIRCNRLLGMSKDDVAVLLGGSDYLKSWDQCKVE